MTFNNKQLGKNIRNQRMIAGLTQKQLADKVNITPTRLCNWEKGTRTPSIKCLLAISRALEICISTLLIGVDTTNNLN